MQIDRAAAVVIAIGLTAAVLVWWAPILPIWWLIAALALSFWAYALQPSILETLRSAYSFSIGWLQYLDSLLVRWRTVVVQWLNRWFWNRFRPTTAPDSEESGMQRTNQGIEEASAVPSPTEELSVGYSFSDLREDELSLWEHSWRDSSSEEAELTTPPNSTHPRKYLIPLGWVLVGILLLPITALLIWANYSLLVLGLEAVFGFTRIEWQVLGVVITAEDVVAVVLLLAEVLVGFFFAELVEWVNFLEFDNKLKSSQRRLLAWIAGLIFVSLIVAEVGVGLFRQHSLDKEAKRREKEALALSMPSVPTLATDPKNVDLTQPSMPPPSDTPGTQTDLLPQETASGWDSFVQSLPFIGTVLLHTAVPSLSAGGAIFVMPLVFVAIGVLITLFTTLPLTLLIVLSDLIIAATRGFYALLVSLLNLIALPANLIIEGIKGLWRR